MNSLWLLALAAGMCIPVQAGLNAQLGAKLGSSQAAAFVSFVVGSSCLAAYLAMVGISLPLSRAWANTPAYVWLGGVLGAFFVSSTIFLAPRLGALTMLGLVILGQMVVSIAVDHYGLLGYPVREASPARMLGVVLLVAGVVLTHR